MKTKSDHLAGSPKATATPTTTVWRRAAEIADRKVNNLLGAETYVGCCFAVALATNWRDDVADPLLKRFAKAFKPRSANLFWWPDPLHGSAEDRTARVLALLLMEQIEADQ